MSREVKRVALDFDWPYTGRNKVWKGYINPHRKICDDCYGTGQTPGRNRLEDFIRLMVLSAEDALSDRRQHPYFNSDCFFSDGEPGGDFVDLIRGLSPDKPYRDTTDMHGRQWEVSKSILKAAGLDPETWGMCPTCSKNVHKDGDSGSGIDPAIFEEYDAWEDYDPPSGEGWQMWETTSEGSPISPVCKTPEELAKWLSDDGASSFGRDTATYEQWFLMIKAGWAPSALMSAETGLVSGVVGIANNERDKGEVK